MAIRLGGAPETFADRLGRLEQAVPGRSERCLDLAEAALWQEMQLRRFPAAETDLLVKVPVTLLAIPELDRQLESAGARRRYSAGGSVAGVTWHRTAPELDLLLSGRDLSGLVVSGKTPNPLVGGSRGDGFRRRVKSALDPQNHFPDF